MPIINAAVMLFTDESKNRRSELGQGHRRSELGASGSTRSELRASVPPGISFDHLIFITIDFVIITFTNYKLCVNFFFAVSDFYGHYKQNKKGVSNKISLIKEA